MGDGNHFINAQDAIVGMLHDYLAEKEDAKRYQEENARLKAELQHIQAELQRLTTWQPIETAPKDGTEIIGCDGYCIEVTAFFKGTKPYQRKEAWVVANDDEGYAQDFNPTHWMPLPNPIAPVKQTKSKKPNA